MKINSEHYHILETAIRELVSTGESVKIFDNVKKDTTAKDLNMRYRWELLWAAMRLPSWKEGTMVEICKYATLHHVDTALERIVKSYDVR